MFLLRSVKLESVSTFGKNSNHTGATFSKAGGYIKGIGFFKKPENWTVPMKEGEEVHVIATIEKNTFRGANEIRLRIIDTITNDQLL